MAHDRLRHLGRATAVTALALLAVGCGIRILRDLSETKPQDVVYDDLCGLQGYFDTLATGKVARPIVLRASEIERADGRQAAGGKATFGILTDFQLTHFKRLLRQNWKGIPAEVLTANRIEVELRWAEKAGVRRVVTTEMALLSASKRTWELPYHVCLSDFFFGDPLYATRREMLGLPPFDASTTAAAAQDGAAREDARPDAAPRGDTR